MECVIGARDVVLRFGHVTALDSFSADVPRGVVGLLGPNGAGKTSFIKACLGLVSLDSGSISVAGLDPVRDMIRVRDMVGYMPEDDCLMPSASAVELVAYFGRLSGMPPGDAMQRTHEMLDFVGIGEERYRNVGEYSTGMKQRVKLAQAVVHDPEILFLDEPTSGMDPQGREDMLRLIRSIGELDKAVVVSSHLLHEVERVCRYAVIIDSGRLVVSGAVEELVSEGGSRMKLKLRGGELQRMCTVLTVSEERGQVSAVVDGIDPEDLFSLAARYRVQVRYIGPATQTLEDVFLRHLGGEQLWE